MSASGDELYEWLGPIVQQYGDPDNALYVYSQAFGAMFEPIDVMIRDENNDPGWSQVLDLTRAQLAWLRWLGQWVGYFVPLTVTEGERTKIITRSAHRRGGIPILLEVVAEHLIPAGRIIIRERDTSAHHITVYIYASDIATTAAAAEAAARSQKAAGLIMDFIVLTTENWTMLTANQASWNIVVSKFTNWNAVVADPDKP